MKFQYYQIRPCVEHSGSVHSFLGPEVQLRDKDDWQFVPDVAEDCAKNFANTVGSTVFWRIFGIDERGMSTPIGDHESFDAAMKTLEAILVPLRLALNEIVAHWQYEGQYGDPDGVSMIEDILNQSSNRDRL